MSASLVMPNAAFAAEYIEVDGTGYEAANGAASGEGWSWDGADDMVLNGYNGGYIYADGDLNIELIGQNTVSAPIENPGPAYYGDAIGVYEAETQKGDLAISGEGSLRVVGDDVYGIYVSEGGLTIEGTDVSVEVSGAYASGIRVQGNLEVMDSTLSIDMEAEDAEGGMSGAQGVFANSVIVENSTVNVSVQAETIARGVTAYGGISIEGSEVSVSSAAGDGAVGVEARTGDMVVSDSSLAVEVAAPTEDGSVSGVYSYGWDITFEGSDVTVDGSGSSGVGIASLGAEGNRVDAETGDSIAPVITFDNSDVSVTGFSGPAVVSAVEYYDVAEQDIVAGEGMLQGQVVIKNGTLVSSEGDAVLDYLEWGSYGTEDGLGGAVYGQLIGVGEGLVESLEDERVAQEVVVASADTVIEETRSNMGLSTTGDATNAVPLMAAGLTAAVAAAFVRRKSAE